MSDRDYDFVVFGATGFTGKFVVQEIQRIEKSEQISFAVAGRNRNKMKKMLTNVEDNNIIVADVSDYQSLLLMCKRARVVLNCVGPYRHFGEEVVRASVEAKTNYVDICGEPQFLENMQLKYNESAEKSGVFIVGACGFDSIPSDLGVMYAQSQFKGVINGINAYLNIRSGANGLKGHYATYESAVQGFGDVSTLKKVRKAFGDKPLPKVGPRLKSKGSVHFCNELNKYAVPFVGADRSVVLRSQRYIHRVHDRMPVQYSMYSCVSSVWYVFVMFLYGAVFQFLAARSWGRNLLLKHPKLFTAGIFSHDGPSDQDLKETSFSITMFCEGYSDGVSYGESRGPDRKMTVTVSGSEPGYVATPILMVQSALVIVKEREKLPENGGVFPPGAVFYRTSLIERLQESGVSFKTSG